MKKLGKSPKNITKAGKILKAFNLSIAISLATVFALPQKSFSQTTNHKNNYSQHIIKISVSDYQKILLERDKNIQQQLDKWGAKESTKEYLERTQKEIFLNSYKNNKNMLRNNIDKIGTILQNKYGYKNIKDPVEILNTAIGEIANSGEIEGLNTYTRNIKINSIDINTINAIGFIEAQNKGEISFNPSAIGVLSIIEKILEKAKPTLNYIKEEGKTKSEKGKVENESGKKFIIEDKKVKTDTQKQTTQEDAGIINLDEEIKDIEKIKPDSKKQISPKEKDLVKEKSATIVEKDEKKSDGNINLDDDVIINLDKGEKKEKVITNKEMSDLLDNEEEMEKYDYQKKLEEIYEHADETVKEEIKEQIRNGDLNKEDKDINLDEEINEKLIEKTEEIEDIVDIESPSPEESMDMFVDYNFQKNLAQNLPIQTQKENLQQLIDENRTVKKFVKELEGVGINFNKGDDTDVNRTSAILRDINGNFEYGFDAIDIVKESGVKGAEAVKQIIFLTWAKSIVENDNLKIVENMSWNKELLEKNLDNSKLNGVTYQEIINIVNGFKDNELKKVFMYHLLNNDIVLAQRVMGMELDCDSRYPEYRAGNKLGRTEINKIKKHGESRRYMEQNEIMANPGIPQDVKATYMKFVNKELNNKGKQYSILSKTDFNIYLFSSNHRLLSRQNTLIGSEVGDHKNNPMAGSRTTPGGLYEVGRAFDKTSSGQSFFTKYGTHYIVLIPMEGQYTMSNQYTMGIHGTYERDPSRDRKIKSNNARDRRDSNGCINVEDQKFGEMYNQLKVASILYITKEPNERDIKNFIANK
ncbi:MAG: L,D-transpeptidase family protein [Candidatus Absconditabacterales bacterium]|nr:L,D-transpeptidase family protein [Candidatus Absconditabacterales bacterium]